jgi:hypothetical protein
MLVFNLQLSLVMSVESIIRVFRVRYVNNHNITSSLVRNCRALKPLRIIPAVHGDFSVVISNIKYC